MGDCRVPLIHRHSASGLSILDVRHPPSPTGISPATLQIPEEEYDEDRDEDEDENELFPLPSPKRTPTTSPILSHDGTGISNLHRAFELFHRLCGRAPKQITHSRTTTLFILLVSQSIQAIRVDDKLDWGIPRHVLSRDFRPITSHHMLSLAYLMWYLQEVPAILITLLQAHSPVSNTGESPCLTAAARGLLQAASLLTSRGILQAVSVSRLSFAESLLPRPPLQPLPVVYSWQYLPLIQHPQEVSAVLITLLRAHSPVSNARKLLCLPAAARGLLQAASLLTSRSIPQEVPRRPSGLPRLFAESLLWC